MKSEVWTITHCLGLGHESIVCAVSLRIHRATDGEYYRMYYGINISNDFMLIVDLGVVQKYNTHIWLEMAVTYFARNAYVLRHPST